MSVYGQRSIGANWLPVVRSGRTLIPMQMNVTTINKSELIRQTFSRLGNVSNSRVVDVLAVQGIKCHVSLIASQRKELLKRKHMC